MAMRGMDQSSVYKYVVPSMSRLYVLQKLIVSEMEKGH